MSGGFPYCYSHQILNAEQPTLYLAATLVGYFCAEFRIKGEVEFTLLNMYLTYCQHTIFISNILYLEITDMGTCCATQKTISLTHSIKPSPTLSKTTSTQYRLSVSEASKVSDNHERLEQLAKHNCQKLFRHTSVHACFKHADAQQYAYEMDRKTQSTSPRESTSNQGNLTVWRMR